MNTAPQGVLPKPVSGVSNRRQAAMLPPPFGACAAIHNNQGKEHASVE